MYFTREAQIEPEKTDAANNGGKATASAEHLSEHEPGVLTSVFGGGATGAAASNEAWNLMRSPALSWRSNAGLRVIALSRAQQTSGNHFVQRLVNRAQSAIAAPTLIQRQCSCGACEKCGIPAAAPHTIADTVGRGSYFSAGGFAPQASLLPGALAKDMGGVVVGDANDPMEHEADRVADAASQSTLQRKDAGSSAPTSSHVSSNLNVSESGSPLQHNVREKVEPVLGADLSRVRVHDNALANEAAAGLDAKAFTHENHIWLGPQQSASDVRLMAHEATHVVQQTAGHAGVPQPTIQRQFFWGHTQHPNQPAYPRPPDPYPKGLQCDQRALAAMHTETVELKGTPDFRPSYWMSEGLYCARPDAVSVRVQFGKLALGVIRIRMADPTTTSMDPSGRMGKGPYETVDDLAFIDLTHPAFPGAGTLAPPRMYLKIRNSVVTGFVSFIPFGAKISLADLPNYQRAQTLGQVLGWRGLVDVKPGSIVNEVKDGTLRFALQNFTFGMQDLQGLAGVTSEQADYTGTGNFSVTDEATSFSAETVIKAEGATDATMPLHRVQGKIFGTASLNLTMSPRDAFGGVFSGSLQGAYANGVMTIRGTARYRSAKLNGTVTVLIAPRGVAWTEVLKQLPTGGPGITVGAALAPGHVVVGWGSLDFHINEWLTGHASVVVDPDGYITSHGILRPTVEYQFLDEPGKYEINKPIAHLSPPAVTFATIGIASLNGSIEADLRAGGKIGPARLYGLEIEGQFSTRPGVVFTGKITGRANLSAQASLGAQLTGSLSGSIGTPPAHVRVVTVTLGITGQATLRAYVELQPTFERIAGPNPDEAQYKITGTLTAAGAVSLALGGFVKFSILGVGPKINLGKVQYPLGGVGAKATFSHILGSHKDIEIEVTSTDFNDAQFTGFVQDLFKEEAPKDEGDHEAKLGQSGGVPPPAAPHPTEFRTTFTMNGTPHTLWLEHTPGPVLKMASNGDDSLDTKLRNEIATVDQQRKAQEPGDEADLLAAEERSASSLLSQSVSVEHALTDLESEARANPDASGLNEIASGLTAYATQYGKTDLAQAPPTPTPGPADVVIKDGRYEITNRAQLEAVRKARPTKPFDLDPSLEPMWEQYLKYFDERIRLIDRDLTPPRRKIRREPPSTWEKYLESRATYDPMRQKKEFQETLKKTISDRQGDVKPEQIEIDVGLKKRSTTGYADVIVTDAQNNLTVYSAKVRNVLEQVRKLTNPTDVERWIASQLRSDIKEAIDYYGGTVQVRRKSHPLYGQSVFVKQVILVWDSRVVPSDYHAFFLTRGNQLGVEYRKTISVQVQLQP